MLGIRGGGVRGGGVRNEYGQGVLGTWGGGARGGCVGNEYREGVLGTFKDRLTSDGGGGGLPSETGTCQNEFHLKMVKTRSRFRT